MSVTSMGTQLSVRLDDDLEEELEAYRNSHDFPPDKSQVVRVALENFLEEQKEAGKY